MRRRWTSDGLALLLATATFACSSSSQSTSSSSSSGDPNGSTSSPTDRDHVERSDHGLLAAQVALVAADSAFSFDPTIDPGATADQNVVNIRANASQPTCAKVSGNGAALTIDYGGGCLVGAMTIAGSMSITVGKSGAT